MNGFIVKPTAVFIGTFQQSKELLLELDKMAWAEKRI